MSYTINHFNGTPLATIADGTVNTSTDLTLIGKNYAGYGQAQNDNFVWLLENFASASPGPSNPQAGQIWYNTTLNKLQFYDINGTWRTTGGASIGSSFPTNLTVGDFFFNTASNQLYAYTGVGNPPFTLIGPQEVVGAMTTQMLSTTVTDSNNVHRPVIQGVVDGQVVFMISSTSFLLPTGQVTGFDQINQGITLTGTLAADNGVTAGSFEFTGTATNAKALNGVSASSFVTSSAAQFTASATFSDTGFVIGNPTAKLSIANDSTTGVPTLKNVNGPQINFVVTSGASTINPMTINGTDLLPGITSTSSLGSQTLQWLNVYATNFYGTATNSNYLSVGGTYVSATTGVPGGNVLSVAARDTSGNLTANVFNGNATSANYADLAEKYLPSPEYPNYSPGTVVCVGGSKEICPATYGSKAIGAISTNPAYMMNQDLAGGIYVALKGRVPVRLVGGCTKGDLIAPYGSGQAASIGNPAGTNGGGNLFSSDDTAPICFAVALADCTNSDETLVECVIL